MRFDAKPRRNPASNKNSPSPEQRKAPAEKKTILLVEDNPDEVELALLALNQSNLADQILVANDGEEALRILFGDPSDQSPPAQPQPSIVFLDLKLPKVDGLEVLQRIRADERTRKLPVVVLTSSADQQDMLASYALECTSFVRKPLNFSEFCQMAHRLGVYWLYQHERNPRIPAERRS